MHSFVKNVFIIIGTMMISLVLFFIVFGETGRGVMWGALEPVFQTNWNMNTYNDGALIGTQLTHTFDEAVEINDSRE